MKKNVVKLLFVIQVDVHTTIEQYNAEVNLEVRGMSTLALFVITSWCQTLKPFADVEGRKLFGVSSGAITLFYFTVWKCCLLAEDPH